MGRKLKRTLVGVGALVGLALLGTAAAVHRLRVGPPLPSGTLEIAGPEAPVEVFWDTAAVPHVFAASERDALFAQGFLHARHRLWQMEMFRRVATGRLSEIFGEQALESDRFLRTLGLHRAARRAVEALSPETRALLDAYVAGINAALEEWPGFLPAEFVILRIRPEPFTAADAVAIEKIMAWDLAEYGETLRMVEAYRRLGPEGFQRVRPHYPEWGVTILGDTPWPGRVEDGLPEVLPPGLETDGGSAGGDEAAGGAAPGAFPRPTRTTLGETKAAASYTLPSADVLASARIPDALLPLLKATNAVRASNSWVVGPERSASGRPLLANDMHLALNQPTIYYLVGLHAPGLDVVGMSIPGAPGVVAGHTGGVAWGYTNASLDDTDLFIERVDPADSTRYLTPDGSAPFTYRTEVIPVRGGGADTLTVRETRHGPVITGVEARVGEELIALRWVAHDPGTTFDGILRLNRARTADDVVRALRLFTNPHQNVVFGDTAGGWGYWMAGRIPRRPCRCAPILPVPGWTGEHDWQGYLDFEEHPHALAPEQGYIVTANNRQSRTPVSELINDGNWWAPYRAQRITQLLELTPVHDAASMVRTQLDHVSLQALRMRRVAAASFRAAGLAREAALLEAWDGAHPLDAVEPTLYHAWWRRLRSLVAEEIYGGEPGYLALSALERMLEAGEVGPDLLARAASLGAGDAAGRTWGEAHTLTLGHPLASVPLLKRLFGFGREGVPRVGGPQTVNVAGFGGPPGTFRVTSGPSQRHIVDLAELEGTGGFILPGGQSGAPAGPHSMDQLRRWQSGDLLALPVTRAGAERRS